MVRPEQWRGIADPHLAAQSVGHSMAFGRSSAGKTSRPGVVGPDWHAWIGRRCGACAINHQLWAGPCDD